MLKAKTSPPLSQVEQFHIREEWSNPPSHTSCYQLKPRAAPVPTCAQTVIDHLHGQVMFYFSWSPHTYLSADQSEESSNIISLLALYLKSDGFQRETVNILYLNTFTMTTSIPITVDNLDLLSLGFLLLLEPFLTEFLPNTTLFFLTLAVREEWCIDWGILNQLRALYPPFS